MTAEKLLEHQGTILLAQSDGCAVWQFRNETGDGTITTYEIFSGVMLAFNDFHMERYECDFVADRRMLAIDHCREGAHGLRRERQLGRLRGGGGYGKSSATSVAELLLFATGGRFEQKCAMAFALLMVAE